jgi:hypothetical protein
VPQKWKLREIGGMTSGLQRERANVLWRSGHLRRSHLREASTDGLSTWCTSRPRCQLTAWTPCLAFLPTSTENTQRLRHLRSRARPSMPTILCKVVFTLRPSKCNHSKGAFVLFGGKDGVTGGGLFGEGIRWA